MTQDVVFKKFFIEKPEMLDLILKHFLNLDEIKELSIVNPELPTFTGKAKTKQQLEEEAKKFERILKELGKFKKEGQSPDLEFLESELQGEDLMGCPVFLKFQ